MSITALALAINVLLHQGGDQYGSRPPPATQYAHGVPHPHLAFGYNPLTIQPPEDPPEWPSAENSSFYYVDSSHPNATDTNNAYGYPDQPRLTPVEGNFTDTHMYVKNGTYAVGGDGVWTMTFTSTNPAEPCFFIAENATFLDEIRDSGSFHVIYDGLRFTESRNSFQVQNASKYVVGRNGDFDGTGIADANSAVVSCAGNSDTDRAEFIVFSGNSVHDWGDDDSASENDYHAFLPGPYCSYVWCIGNTAYNNGGDSIQVGQASYTGLQRPDHVYIAKNHFHDDRENAVDIKGSVDVIISQNTMYGYAAQSSSSGEVIVIHDSNEYCWVINNELHSGLYGVSATAGTHLYVMGNLIRDLSGTVDFAGPYYEPNNGTGITAHTGPFVITQNTYVNSIIGWSASSNILAGSRVYANVFGAPSNPAGWNFMVSNSSDTADLDADYNVYENFRARLNATDYDNIVPWRSDTGFDANSVVGDPQFIDPASNNYDLQITSPAIGLIPTEDAAYALFESRYSNDPNLSNATLDIRFDINGNPKPTTNADAGAYQRAA